MCGTNAVLCLLANFGMPFKNSYSTGQHCAVYGCSNNQKKRNAARKQLCGTHNVVQEVCGCNIYLLHRFPADVDLKRQWIAAVNRKDFFPSSSSRVCSVHFVDGKRSDQNPVPVLRLGYERKVLKGRRCLVNYDSQQPKKKRTVENLPPTSPACSLHLDMGDTDFLEDAEKNPEAVHAALSGEQDTCSEQQDSHDTGSDSGEQDTGSEQQHSQDTVGEKERNASLNDAALENHN